MGTGIDVVTGAFSYTGGYVARRLLAAGRQVRTLTGHPERAASRNVITVFPYDFDRPERLTESLRGAETLYNTYWIRYPYGASTYDQAVKNSTILFQAAKRAGVRRIVHVSIANPSESSPLPYYSGKARVEQALLETGLSYAILRPTVIFGKEGILVNNIAWMVRHFPWFAVPGNGRYRLAPIYVEDFADALVAAGQENQNRVRDAMGPETFTFDELVGLMAQELGRKIPLVHISPSITYAMTMLMGLFVGDLILTKEEIQGLLDDLLVSNQPPLGTTRLSHWIQENSRTLGTTYLSELKIHFEKNPATQRLS